MFARSHLKWKPTKQSWVGDRNSWTMARTLMGTLGILSWCLCPSGVQPTQWRPPNTWSVVVARGMAVWKCGGRSCTPGTSLKTIPAWNKIYSLCHSTSVNPTPRHYSILCLLVLFFSFLRMLDRQVAWLNL